MVGPTVLSELAGGPTVYCYARLKMWLIYFYYRYHPGRNEILLDSAQEVRGEGRGQFYRRRSNRTTQYAFITNDSSNLEHEIFYFTRTDYLTCTNYNGTLNKPVRVFITQQTYPLAMMKKFIAQAIALLITIFISVQVIYFSSSTASTVLKEQEEVKGNYVHPPHAAANISQWWFDYFWLQWKLWSSCMEMLLQQSFALPDR